MSNGHTPATKFGQNMAKIGPKLGGFDKAGQIPDSEEVDQNCPNMVRILRPAGARKLRERCSGEHVSSNCGGIFGAIARRPNRRRVCVEYGMSISSPPAFSGTMFARILGFAIIRGNSHAAQHTYTLKQTPLRTRRTQGKAQFELSPQPFMVEPHASSLAFDASSRSVAYHVFERQRPEALGEIAHRQGRVPKCSCPQLPHAAR